MWMECPVLLKDNGMMWKTKRAIMHIDQIKKKTNDCFKQKCKVGKVISCTFLTCIMLLQISGCGSKKEIPLHVIDDKYRTFYEVFVYSFFDSGNDGIGDLDGLTSKLDYLNDADDATDDDLSVNGIWLMPIMPSTTYHKYDVIDYCAIDKQYGSMEDFEEFMAECNKRDIHVILDLVMNHTSSKHEWFTEACDYLRSLDSGAIPSEEECKYFGYYHFSKEKKNEDYYEVPGTEYYYEAGFWSEMPDLDLENQAVRAEFEQICDFWLAKGVSGFRLDAAKEFVSDDTAKNVEILTWFQKMVKEKDPDSYIVTEVWTDKDVYAKYYESGIDSTFDFAFSNSDGIIAQSVRKTGGYDASSYGKAVAGLYDDFSVYNKDFIDAPFYTNHDMSRSAGYYSGEQSESQTKIAGALNLLMSGNVFVYYGEELGMKGSGADENKRLGMLWSMDKDLPGMCKGPEGADSVKMKYNSLEEQKASEYSIYQYYKEAIKLRNQFPEIARGKVEFLESVSTEDICVLKKKAQDNELLIVINCSAQSHDVDLSQILVQEKPVNKSSLAEALLVNGEQITVDKNSVHMPAFSIGIFQNKK